MEGDVETGDEDNSHNSTVAVKILNQNANLNDKARFLDEARLHRDLRHENVLPLLHHCLGEEPWMLMFEMCLEVCFAVLFEELCYLCTQSQPRLTRRCSHTRRTVQSSLDYGEPRMCVL